MDPLHGAEALRLPPEILSHIAESLDSFQDVVDFVAVSRYTSASRRAIYFGAKRNPRIFKTMLGVFQSVCSRGGDVDTVVSSFHLTADDARLENYKCLRNAVVGGHVRVVAFLVEHFGFTTTDATRVRFEYDEEHLASVKEILPCLKLLYEHLLATAQDMEPKFCMFALHCAVKRGSLEFVQCLVPHIDMSVPDGKKGMLFAIHSACCVGDLPILRHLVEYHEERFPGTLEHEFPGTLEHGVNDTFLMLYIAVRDGHYSVLLYVDQYVHFALEAVRSVFYAACEFGHVAVMQWLLSKGLTAADARSENNAALRLASAEGHLDIVRVLFEELHFSAVDACPSHNSVLQSAIEAGHMLIVEYLFKTVGLALTDAHRNAALQTACCSGHLAIVKFFVEELDCTPADVKCYDDVVRGGFVPVLQYLWELDPLQVIDMRTRASHLRAVAANGALDMLQFLARTQNFTIAILRAGDDAIAREAAEEGHVHIVRWMMETCCLTLHDVCYYSVRRVVIESAGSVRCLLHGAIRFSRVEVVELILEYFKDDASASGASPCSDDSLEQWIPDKGGIFELAWHMAVERGEIAIVKVIAEQLAISLPDPGLASLVAYQGNMDVAKYVLGRPGQGTCTRAEALALVRADNNLALRRAAKLGHVDFLHFLADRFFLTAEDARACNNYALRVAAHIQNNQGAKVTLCLFERFGLTAADARSNNNYALVTAATDNRVNVVRALIETGGLALDDVASRNYQVLHSAAHNDGDTVYEYLLSHFDIDDDFIFAQDQDLAAHAAWGAAYDRMERPSLSQDILSRSVRQCKEDIFQSGYGQPPWQCEVWPGDCASTSSAPSTPSTPSGSLLP